MPDDLIDSLASAGDHRLFRGHRFQIDASQTLVPAGQSKEGAAAHRLGDLLSTLTAKKTNLVRDVEIVGQPGQAAAFGTVADNLAGNSRIAGNHGGEGAQ